MSCIPLESLAARAFFSIFYFFLVMGFGHRISRAGKKRSDLVEEDDGGEGGDDEAEVDQLQQGEQDHVVYQTENSSIVLGPTNIEFYF